MFSSFFHRLDLPLLHPLIQVKTHPISGTTEKMSCVWSHHQKTVTIDEKITFVGGIGRRIGDLQKFISLLDLKGLLTSRPRLWPL
jgi:hypothetical protein